MGFYFINNHPQVPSLLLLRFYYVKRDGENYLENRTDRRRGFDETIGRVQQVRQKSEMKAFGRLSTGRRRSGFIRQNTSTPLQALNRITKFHKILVDSCVECTKGEASSRTATMKIIKYNTFYEQADHPNRTFLPSLNWWIHLLQTVERELRK